MKLKNNLTREAFANSYREQGYDEYQIRELILMLEKHSGLEKLMTTEINSTHMAIYVKYVFRHGLLRPRRIFL